MALALGACPALLVRIVEHRNAPLPLLVAMVGHPDPRVRTAVADNPMAPPELLRRLCQDRDIDVRFQMAENHSLTADILNFLAQDENPYVADRARKTLDRLASPMTSSVRTASACAEVPADPRAGEATRPAGRSLVERVPRKLKLLVIEDNPADMRLLEKLLVEWPFELHNAKRLADGLKQLTEQVFDLVLLDLSLPDGQGIDTVFQVHCQAPHLPIVVLTGLEDEAIGIAAVQAGAQDYLVKGEAPPGLLGRSIHYAVERHQTDLKMKQLNLSLERRILQLAAANQELDKLGAALTLSCEQAIQASNFKSQFVARVTHDIRTPVSAVLAITDLLLQEDTRCDHKATKRLIELIRIAAQSQLRLLTEVLDFSRVEEGKVQLEDIEFSPVTLLEDVAELFAASAAKQGVALMTYIDTQLDPILLGDPSRLREILVNLTNNALKFTSKGEVVLRVLKESEDDRYVTVRFWVSDTGTGMTEEALTHLFEPFSRSSLSSKFGGTGLGLSICKRFVDLMGGTIGAESEEGKGTVVWFALRLRRPGIQPAEESSSTYRIPTQRAPFRFLVVDPSSTARDITYEYLKGTCWCTCAAASNAAEALVMLEQAQAKSLPFDLALIDLESCKPGSFELAAMIQANPILSATRLIFATSVDHRQRGEQAWGAGFSAYVTKPIRISALRDCVTSVMASPSGLASPEPVEWALPIGYEPAAAKGMRILVVDDSATTRRVIAQQLIKLGAAVDMAKDGQEAVDSVMHKNYALILMDCQMPRVDGLEAARHIREMQSPARRTPILAITGGDAKLDRPACIDAGMDDIIHKPFSLGQLYAALQRWAPK